jgi:hypothetical protein
MADQAQTLLIDCGQLELSDASPSGRTAVCRSRDELPEGHYLQHGRRTTLYFMGIRQ